MSTAMTIADAIAYCVGLYADRGPVVCRLPSDLYRALARELGRNPDLGDEIRVRGCLVEEWY